MEAYVHDAVQDMHLARAQLIEALSAVQPDDWGKFVPFGSRTLHDLLAHVATADHTWALAARELLRGDGAEVKAPMTAAERQAAGDRAVKRGRPRTPVQLLEEMESRRALLLTLYDLLERRHLALSLPSFGDEHNSVRERIWLGYHDRLHAADVRRALERAWHPQKLRFEKALQAGVDALDPGRTLYVIYSVDPVAWELASGNEGWTNRELLAHLATGDWVLQHHLRHILETGKVGAWPDVAEGNADRTSERRWSTDRALIDEYLSMRHETMSLLSELKPEHLDLSIEFWWETPPNRHTILDYVLTFHKHEQRHCDQLRPAMKHARSTR
jgi:hypothetical protein